MSHPEEATFGVELPLDLTKEVQTLLRASGIPAMKDPLRQGNSRRRS